MCEKGSIYARTNLVLCGLACKELSMYQGVQLTREMQANKFVCAGREATKCVSMSTSGGSKCVCLQSRHKCVCLQSRTKCACLQSRTKCVCLQSRPGQAAKVRGLEQLSLYFWNAGGATKCV